MPVLSKGSFSINLGIVKLSGVLSEKDRQCAWELYTELSTRVAMTGKPSDSECLDFGGELYIESLSSFYAFFQEARIIMKAFPVGTLDLAHQNHLGVIISRLMAGVLRPFLEKWQVQYHHWWEYQSNPRLPPIDRQREFPEIKNFLSDWSSVRWISRKLSDELVQKYQLIDTGKQKS